MDVHAQGAGPLRVLWAGTFSARKGAHYLIDAWRMAGLSAAEAVLDHFGAVTLPPGMLGRAPAEFRFRGSVPREELFVMRSACGADIRTLCAGVAPGGGRIMQCIANRAADLSPACKDVLTPFIAR